MEDKKGLTGVDAWRGLRVRAEMPIVWDAGRVKVPQGWLGTVERVSAEGIALVHWDGLDGPGLRTTVGNLGPQTMPGGEAVMAKMIGAPDGPRKAPTMQATARGELLALATTMLEAPEVTQSALEGFAHAVCDYLRGEAPAGAALMGAQWADQQEQRESERAELLIQSGRLRDLGERLEEERQQYAPHVTTLADEDVDFLRDLGAALGEFFRRGEP